MYSRICLLFCVPVLLVLSLTSDAQNICADTASCGLQNKSSVIIESCHALTFDGACCVNSSTDEIIGLGLENCTLSSLKPYLAQLSSLKYLSLQKSKINSADALNFKGMTDLEYVWLLDSSKECPGTNEAWHRSKDGVCEDQNLACDYRPVTCPDHSSCHNNGPSFRHCICSGDAHGYRCLKTGKFPVTPYVVGLLGSTFVTTGLLWYWTMHKAVVVPHS